MKGSYPRNISIISTVFIFLILFLALANLYINIQFRKEFIAYDEGKVVSIATLCAHYLHNYPDQERMGLLRNLNQAFGAEHIIITDTLGMVLYDAHRTPLSISTSRQIDFESEFGALPAPEEVKHTRNRFLFRSSEPPFFLYVALVTAYGASFDLIFRWHVFYITLSLLLVGFLGIFLIRNLFMPMRYVANLASDMGVAMKKEDFVSVTFNEIFKKMKLKEETLIEFAAFIAHEFRNSIGAICGLARLVEKGKKPARDIIQECHTMEELINRLLEYARPVQLVRSNVEFARLLSESVDRAAIPARISVTITVGEDVPVVTADHELLLMAFTNLLKNSVEAIPDAGEITIKAAREDEYLSITLADTGSGMDPLEVEKIFNPFYSKKEEGMGLGLAYVKKTVELHNGHITVDSVKGKGTTFTITLPLG